MADKSHLYPWSVREEEKRGKKMEGQNNTLWVMDICGTTHGGTSHGVNEYKFLFFPSPLHLTVSVAVMFDRRFTDGRGRGPRAHSEARARAVNSVFNRRCSLSRYLYLIVYSTPLSLSEVLSRTFLIRVIKSDNRRHTLLNPRWDIWDSTLLTISTCKGMGIKPYKVRWWWYHLIKVWMKLTLHWVLHSVSLDPAWSTVSNMSYGNIYIYI